MKPTTKSPSLINQVEINSTYNDDPNYKRVVEKQVVASNLQKKPKVGHSGSALAHAPETLNRYSVCHHLLCERIIEGYEETSLDVLKLPDIKAGEIFKMPDNLDNFKELSFGNIFYELPKARPTINAKNKSIERFRDLFQYAAEAFISEMIYEIFSPKVKREFLIFPKSMDQLAVLSFNTIFHKGVIEFPSSIKNLKMFKIHRIEKYTELKLPDDLPNLISLDIGQISEGVMLSLPSSLNNLRELIFGDIYTQVTIQLPKRLPKLKNLVIGDIDKNAFDNTEVLKLPIRMDSLENFTIAGIGWKVFFKFPKKLDCLKTLDIGKIVCGAKIELPKSFPALVRLKINDFGKNVIFQITNIKNNCKYIYSGFQFPSSCSSLEELEIKKISANAVIELPISLDRLSTSKPGLLNSLTKLTIGSIGSNAVVKLPNLCNNLQDFNIGSIGESVTIELPTSMPNLKTLEYDSDKDVRGYIEKLPLFYLKLKLEGIQFPPSLSILFFVTFITFSFYL